MAVVGAALLFLMVLLMSLLMWRRAEDGRVVDTDDMRVADGGECGTFALLEVVAVEAITMKAIILKMTKTMIMTTVMKTMMMMMMMMVMVMMMMMMMMVMVMMMMMMMMMMTVTMRLERRWR
ncbi:hypothetical protein AK812_SmicGene30518 [Symbiodinium microadriaticum]|uniref:Uncharacterized protein n=1 Tax=Symbiodinium microadriaticum TaxID=2951 RepID=A0A1Q9CZ48_SYMMI|nr:hypothetical protein AK812_SmicGene30518 [Symbiodinium microadriaticum]